VDKQAVLGRAAKYYRIPIKNTHKKQLISPHAKNVRSVQKIAFFMGWVIHISPAIIPASPDPFAYLLYVFRRSLLLSTTTTTTIIIKSLNR
jgi:hypothetical protein